MTKPTRTAAAITAGCLLLLTITIALPLLVIAALTGTSDRSGLDDEGISPTVADAYRRAADAAPDFAPPCEIPVWILAGVGEIESGHGTHGGATVDPDGDVTPPIIGIALPGLGADTDDGAWDGSTTVDHAVGPMQFIPATWRTYGTDANNDGQNDPHNIYDAALAAAAYLCASGSPMVTEADWRRGIYAYNHSNAYVNDVLDAAYRYRDQPTDPPATRSPGAAVELVDVTGIGPTNVTWAHQVEALLAAAAADGITLTGSSYRDPAQQIALREAHCGTSNYAVYDMPSSQCSPPTARPGYSQHEVGLAIDFDNCSLRGSACYQWLNSNAARFGMYNLPSEPWHWSVNGN